MNHKIVEVKKLHGETRIIDAEENQVIYIADISESQVYVKGKCMKIVGIDIDKSFIGATKVTTLMEIARMKNSLVVVDNAPMLVMEDCVECRVGLASEHTELRVRRNSSLSVVVLENTDISTKTPSELDEMCREKKEQLVPEEIQVVIKDGKINSSIAKNV